MSIRAAAQRLLQNGRILLQTFRPHHKASDVVDGIKGKLFPLKGGTEELVSKTNSGGRASAVRSVGYQFHLHARRLFVDGILERVTHSISAELRRKAAKKLFYGDSAPFFALVGVSLASGTGILTKDDELEGICWEIRDAVSKLHWIINNDPQETERIGQTLTGLSEINIGPVLAKGCNAVVYAASIKKDGSEMSQRDLSAYSYALKMMFNYDAESNASSILKAMYRETVPAYYQFSNDDIQAWEKSFAESKKSLPPHPNIVAMYCAFADRVPVIPGSLSLYPDALPSRINPGGYGRNMSLFLLMKRYDCSLREFLEQKKIHVRDAILLLTQLLEGVFHMNKHSVAHRDLKSDNILLDLLEGDQLCPSLIITDFGCCLADRTHGLSLPYHTHDTDRGGNAALMAPEVATAEPGPFTYINYSKSDCWAVGTIAYELFCGNNPFYKSNTNNVLSSATYEESELPELDPEVPFVIRNLVKNLLSRRPAKRMTAEMAATVCQLHLWAPSAWMSQMPSSAEIIQWLLCLTTKVLCERRRIDKPTFSDSTSVGNRRTLPEYQLISTFLARAKLKLIRDSLEWIHDL